MTERTVAVVGLGLIGGSLARDLHALGFRVLGADADDETLQAALREDCIDHALREDAAGIEAADVVLIAVPVGSAPEVLRRLAPRLRASLVMDAGSTKRGVLDAATAAGIADRFVGAHPLAGDHRSGWAASREGLFRDATVFLCPTASTGPGAIERAVVFWSAVGARPRMDDAAEHDHRMAWLSHLPQAAASALALAIAQSGLPAALLGPGGRDTTRLASSSPALWTDILLENAHEVEPALAALERSIGALRETLKGRDEPALDRLLKNAKRWKDGE